MVKKNKIAKHKAKYQNYIRDVDSIDVNASSFDELVALVKRADKMLKVSKKAGYTSFASTEARSYSRINKIMQARNVVLTKMTALADIQIKATKDIVKHITQSGFSLESQVSTLDRLSVMDEPGYALSVIRDLNKDAVDIYAELYNADVLTRENIAGLYEGYDVVDAALVSQGDELKVIGKSSRKPHKKLNKIKKRKAQAANSKVGKTKDEAPILVDGDVENANSSIISSISFAWTETSTADVITVDEELTGDQDVSKATKKETPLEVLDSDSDTFSNKVPDDFFDADADNVVIFEDIQSTAEEEKVQVPPVVDGQFSSEDRVFDEPQPPLVDDMEMQNASSLPSSADGVTLKEVPVESENREVKIPAEPEKPVLTEVSSIRVPPQPNDDADVVVNEVPTVVAENEQHPLPQDDILKNDGGIHDVAAFEQHLKAYLAETATPEFVARLHGETIGGRVNHITETYDRVSALSDYLTENINNANVAAMVSATDIGAQTPELLMLNLKDDLQELTDRFAYADKVSYGTTPDTLPIFNFNDFNQYREGYQALLGIKSIQQAIEDEDSDGQHLADVQYYLKSFTAFEDKRNAFFKDYIVLGEAHSNDGGSIDLNGVHDHRENCSKWAILDHEDLNDVSIALDGINQTYESRVDAMIVDGADLGAQIQATAAGNNNTAFEPQEENPHANGNVVVLDTAQSINEPQQDEVYGGDDSAALTEEEYGARFEDFTKKYKKYTGAIRNKKSDLGAFRELKEAALVLKKHTEKACVGVDEATDDVSVNVYIKHMRDVHKSGYYDEAISYIDERINAIENKKIFGAGAKAWWGGLKTKVYDFFADTPDDQGAVDSSQDYDGNGAVDEVLDGDFVVDGGNGLNGLSINDKFSLAREGENHEKYMPKPQYLERGNEPN